MKKQENYLNCYRKVIVATQVLVLIVACGFADNLFAARDTGKPHIKIIAPLNKAWVTESQVYLAGSINGEDAKSVSVKGAAVAGNGLKVEGNGFPKRGSQERGFIWILAKWSTSSSRHSTHKISFKV